MSAAEGRVMPGPAAAGMGVSGAFMSSSIFTSAMASAMTRLPEDEETQTGRGSHRQLMTS